MRSPPSPAQLSPPGPPLALTVVPLRRCVRMCVQTRMSKQNLSTASWLLKHSEPGSRLPGFRLFVASILRARNHQISAFHVPSSVEPLRGACRYQNLSHGF